jgi:hypothetical protein
LPSATTLFSRLFFVVSSPSTCLTISINKERFNSRIFNLRLKLRLYKTGSLCEQWIYPKSKLFIRPQWKNTLYIFVNVLFCKSRLRVTCTQLWGHLNLFLASIAGWTTGFLKKTLKLHLEKS